MMSASAAKKFFLSVLSYIGKRTKKGCDHGSEVSIVHSRQDKEWSVPLRKPKEADT